VLDPCVEPRRQFSKDATDVRERKDREPRIGFFGHFGQINFGNESTLQAMLYNIRRCVPGAELTCICTNPEVTTTSYGVDAVQMNGVFLKPQWLQGDPLSRTLRKIIIGIPSEVFRWYKAVCTLKDLDALIVVGTGLLTDAYGLVSWGPYSVFKWSVIARACRCKLLFVSVGAGPIYGPLGRWLIRAALSLADFRSYRDLATMQCVRGIGVRTSHDRVYPDLAFSLPENVMPHDDLQKGRRPVVGLGLMQYAGRLSAESPSDAVYRAYLENLVRFVGWLFGRGYDVRLLIGDIFDRPVTREFKSLLRERLGSYDEERVIDEPIGSVEQLLSQIATTDAVVATRFHNVLLALMLKRPVISISFHQKCVSLMREMGLAEYCQNINQLDAERLIEQFRELERNGDDLRRAIGRKTDEYRSALDEQYGAIGRELRGSRLGARCSI